MLFRRLLAAAAILLFPALATAEPVAGSVLDGASLEPIPDATIVLAGPVDVAGVGARTASNDAGNFLLTDVPVGTIELQVSAEGYEPTTERVEVPEGGNERVVIVLFAPDAAGEVIEVTQEAPSLPTPPGKQDLRREEITRIPGTRGDALQSIKSLPGVANADAPGAGPGLVVIRGAAPEDSKVTIDGIEIPLLYHFFGLQSIIPSEFIQAIDFYPGGFGVEEGRATGGVINITTRTEEAEEVSGFAELSFINFAGLVQGPLWKEKNLQFAVGVRRSAIDLLLPAVIPEDANVAFTTAPQYYDGQVRVDWRPDYRHRLTSLFLSSFDLLTLINDNVNPNEPLAQGKFENETSFTRLINTWRYARDDLENRLVASLGTTGFRFEIGGERYLRAENLRIEARDDLLWRVLPQVTVRVGGEASYDAQDIEAIFPLPPQEGSGGPTSFSNAPTFELMETIDNHIAGAYAALDVMPAPGTTLTGGVRVDHFVRFDESTVTPRVSLQQALPGGWTLRAAMGSYSRPGVQNEAIQTDLEPELATQYVLGADYDLRPGVSVSASGFYTDRRQLIVQDAARAAADPNQAYVNRGFGRSFGAEALVRAKLADFFGWVAYTISRSDRVDSPLLERRLFDFDQTHNVIVVGSYQYGGWNFGGRWQYSTGNPTTPVVGSIYLSDVNAYIPVYGEVNSTRLDNAHQLDLRVDRKWTFRTWSLSAYLDVTNVYANPRTLGFRYNFDFTQRESIEELPLVPAIGVRGAF